MTRKHTASRGDQPPKLRKRAEKKLRENLTALPAMSAEDIQSLVHELNIHQIELEMQNEELRQAQVELAHARDRYADLYEFAPVGYVTLNKEGEIVEANLTVTTLLGADRRALLGANLSKFVMRESQDAFYLHRQAVFSKEAKQTCDIEMRRTDGAPLHIRLVSIAMGPPPHAGHCRTALVDVSESKRAEAALRAADRRKDEFLATLAHELRNPLAPIRNALQIIKQENQLAPNLQIARQIIDRQAQHMVRLIDDLMNVSRINRGKLQLHLERVELAGVLAQAIEAVRPYIEEEEHELSVSLPAGKVYLHADPVRLAQVFQNLLHNACRYTPKGGHISLIAERDRNEVVVKVTDTGIGITPEQLASVFEMFAQAQPRTDQSQPGLGIGLSLARELVTMHGGGIEAQSRGPGKGSEFTVRLPAFANAAPEPAAQPQPVEDSGAATGRRILVVDDNRDIVDSLAMLLRLKGNDVATAQDGLDAIAIAEHFRPQVVFLDIGTPRLDGYATCQRLRQQPWGKNILIVALTGWGQENDRAKSKQAGFDDHLVKPVEPEALLRLLEKF